MNNSLIEDNQTELKQCSQGRMSSSIQSTIVAFSNSEGGKIICGVDKNGKTINLSSGEIDKLQTSIASLCKNAFNIIITPHIYRQNRQLIVSIQPATVHQRPVYVKKEGLQRGSYIRVGSSNQVATDQVLQSLMVAAQGGAEHNFIKGQIWHNNFDRELIEDYINFLNDKDKNLYQDFTTEEILLKLRAINESGEISLFGLLAFSKDNRTQELLSPAIRIDVTTYRGVDKTHRDDLYETYTDSRSFRGGLVKQFRDSIKYIIDLIPQKGIIDQKTGFRQDIKKMPTVAIREALINSLIHRDYCVYGAKIDVDFYEDRIEIINPGTSLVPIDKLDISGSITRNPLLMSFAKDLGLAEERARGIRTIKNALKNANLQQPVFENLSGQFFRVILYNSLLVSEADMAWLKELTNFKLKQNQINALVYLKNKPQRKLTNSAYRKINNLDNTGDDVKARKELIQLTKMRLIRGVGQNRSRYYAPSSFLSKLFKNINQD